MKGVQRETTKLISGIENLHYYDKLKYFLWFNAIEPEVI